MEGEPAAGFERPDWAGHILIGCKRSALWLKSFHTGNMSLTSTHWKILSIKHQRPFQEISAQCSLYTFNMQYFLRKCCIFNFPCRCVLFVQLSHWAWLCFALMVKALFHHLNHVSYNFLYHHCSLMSLCVFFFSAGGMIELYMSNQEMLKVSYDFKHILFLSHPEEQ